MISQEYFHEHPRQYIPLISYEIRKRVAHIFHVDIEILSEKMMERFHSIFRSITEKIAWEIEKNRNKITKEWPLTQNENAELLIAERLWTLPSIKKKQETLRLKRVYIRATRSLLVQFRYVLTHPEKPPTLHDSFNPTPWNDIRREERMHNFKRKRQRKF